MYGLSELSTFKPTKSYIIDQIKSVKGLHCVTTYTVPLKYEFIGKIGLKHC